MESHSIVLNSMGIIKPQAIFFAIQAVFNVVLAVFLAKQFGTVGVAWSTTITGVLTTGWGYPWMMRRYLYAGQPDRSESAAVVESEPSRLPE